MGLGLELGVPSFSNPKLSHCIAESDNRTPGNGHSSSKNKVKDFRSGY